VGSAGSVRSTVELNVAIICISLPMLSPLYTRVLATKFNLSPILRSRTKFGSAYSETGGDSKERSTSSSSPYNETVDLVNMSYSQSSTIYGESAHERQNYTKYPIPKGSISVRRDVDQKSSSIGEETHDMV
jgi:hypothetical protein